MAELAQAAAVAVGQPQVGVLLLRRPLHALDTEDDLCPVGRDLRVGGGVEEVEVVGSGARPNGLGLIFSHLVAPVGLVELTIPQEKGMNDE